MATTEYDVEREVLHEHIERDEQDLRNAFDELKDAWRRPFRTIEHIAQHPTPWLFSALLLGFWLGSLNGTHRDAE